MREKPPVFFETLRRMDWPLVAWYLARGHRIFVFDFTYQLKKFAWLRGLIHRERVRRLYVHHASRADGLAIDAAEWLYPGVASHPFVRRMARLYGEEEVAPVFKHALALHAHRYFYTRLYLSRVRELEGISAGELLLVPETYGVWDALLGGWAEGKVAGLTGVRVPGAARLWKRAQFGTARRLYYFLVYGRLWLKASAARLGLFMRRHGTAAAQQRLASHAISITSRFLTDFTAGRRFDFLLGPGGLQKESTAFIVAPQGDGSWVEERRADGCWIIRQSDHTSLPGLFRSSSRRLPSRELAAAAGAGLGGLGAADWLHQAFSSGIRIVLDEFSLLERLRPRAYVYANQYGLDPRWRNALIRRLGGESWWYAYSSGGAYTREEGGPFASDGDFGGRHRFWSYENADHFVAPCRPLVDYYRRHRQTIRHYHDVGNLWSQAILETARGIHRGEILRRWFSSVEGAKVVAWFDSSFMEARHAPSTFREAIGWYTDIRRLADEDPRLRMVIKPSKEALYYVADDPGQQWSHPRAGRRLLEVWEALKNHPRVRFLDRRTDPSLVVAVSDLTITFPYTSVSAEALGARRRAIWYEPGERWRDTLYARAPDLVAHGYPELRRLVERLLWETTDAAYEAFLEQTVRGLVESFLDGKAISRFRALLTAGKEAAPSGDLPAIPVLQETA